MDWSPLAQNFADYLLANKGQSKIIALGGGGSPKAYHSYFVNLVRERAIDLSSFYWTVSDDRLVSVKSDLSNLKMISETLFDPLSCKDRLEDYRWGSASDRDIVAAVNRQYESRLGDGFSRGLCILGVGDNDGHTAGIFDVNTSKGSEEDLGYCLSGRGPEGANRFSLTLSDLQLYDEVWFICNTTNKYDQLTKNPNSVAFYLASKLSNFKIFSEN